MSTECIKNLDIPNTFKLYDTILAHSVDIPDTIESVISRYFCTLIGDDKEIEVNRSKFEQFVDSININTIMRIFGAHSKLELCEDKVFQIIARWCSTHNSGFSDTETDSENCGCKYPVFMKFVDCIRYKTRHLLFDILT